VIEGLPRMFKGDSKGPHTKKGTITMDETSLEDKLKELVNSKSWSRNSARSLTHSIENSPSWPRKPVKAMKS
jgi:hypothetical protein